MMLMLQYRRRARGAAKRERGPVVTPLTEDGRAMRKCEDGWADPDCVACHGTGHVGYGSEAEACDCFLGSEHTRREEEP